LLLADVLRQPRTLPIPRWITPKHYQFTYAEVFGHSSFVLVAISYAVDDFLWLRILAVAGSTCMLFFTYFHPHGRILWLPFKWNALFIIINSYRIVNVFLKQFYAERLPEEFMKLRQKSFYLMDPVDFYRLMKIATIQEYKRGDMVLAQGSQIRCVRMVLDGKLKVLRDGQLTYILEPGNFMSEAGIHIGMMIPGKIESCGTVVADSETTRLLCWDRTELITLLESHEGVRRSLKAILSWDVIRKLKAQRFLLEDMDDPEAWTARRKEQTRHRYAAILHAILQHPQYLHKFRKEVNKYRTIHHIDDAQHAQALKRCGWTVDEYEAGQRSRRKGSPVDDEEDNEDYFGVHGHDDEDDRDHVRNWQWYMHYLYLRLFG
jgi:CRP-like cAMP-binding protein